MLDLTANQLVAHAVGDYVLQSDWMANEKTKKWAAAIAHVVTYTLPFILLTQSWKALLFIAGTHLVIDHWRLARYVCWLKNFLAPRKSRRPEAEWTADIASMYTQWWHPWSECSGTGYHKDRPPFMAVWLMVITDNVMHVLCNGIALHFWR